MMTERHELLFLCPCNAAAPKPKRPGLFSFLNYYDEVMSVPEVNEFRASCRRVALARRARTWWCGHALNPGVYQVYNHQPRTRVQSFGNGGKSIHAKRQPKTIFQSAVPVFGISTRKIHVKTKKNPSGVPMKPRVYEPQKVAGSWDSNGGWFSLPCFLK